MADEPTLLERRLHASAIGEIAEGVVIAYLSSDEPDATAHDKLAMSLKP